MFGASITQGFWDTHGGWVQRLRSYYDSKQITDFSKSRPAIFNLGVSADTSTDVINRFENETKARALGDRELALVFAVGTNNAAVETSGREWSSPDKYRYELIDLIEKARRFTDKIMFVGLAPCDETKTNPVFWNPINYTNARIKLFDDVMEAFCQEQNVPHVPIFGILEEKMKMGIELLQDGLHPNDLGHQLIYEIVRPELDKLLA